MFDAEAPTERLEVAVGLSLYVPEEVEVGEAACVDPADVEAVEVAATDTLTADEGVAACVVPDEPCPVAEPVEAAVADTAADRVTVLE